MPDIDKDRLSPLTRLAYGLCNIGFSLAGTTWHVLRAGAVGWSSYVSNSAQHAESAVWAIRILIGLVASLFLLGGITLARFYPLTREAHAETRDQIAARREATAD